MTFYYGSHISTYKGIINSIETMKLMGGNFLQIFFSNPRGTGMKKYSINDLEKIKNTLEKNNMKLVIHSPYILNFAKPFDKKSWWIRLLIRELTISSKFNSYGSVLHLGKKKCTIKNKKEISIKKEFCENEAYNNMYKSLKYVLDKTPDNSRIILETSSGQGSELGYKLDDFALFYSRFSKKYKKRLKICIDTCHIFMAGYDIRNKNKVLNFFKMVNDQFGINNVVLIHLNDAQRKLGSKIDRHENLGKGYIGINGLKHIIKMAKKLNIPIVLETPVDDHKKEIEIIKNI